MFIFDLVIANVRTCVRYLLFVVVHCGKNNVYLQASCTSYAECYVAERMFVSFQYSMVYFCSCCSNSGMNDISAAL